MISNFTRNSNIIDIDKNIDISCQSSRNQSGKKKKELLFRRMIFIFDEISRDSIDFQTTIVKDFIILEGNENYQEKSGVGSDLMGGG